MEAWSSVGGSTAACLTNVASLCRLPDVHIRGEMQGLFKLKGDKMKSLVNSMTAEAAFQRGSVGSGINVLAVRRAQASVSSTSYISNRRIGMSAKTP